MEKPRISVILPAYNAEIYLSAAIESVLAQTFADFELLVVNDQSTDATERVIGAYSRKDARVKGIQNDHDKGLPRAAKPE